MQLTYLLVVLTIVVQQSVASDFPKFIQKCKVLPAEFDECVLKSANAFMSAISKGDAKYGIAPNTGILSNFTKSYSLTDKFNVKFSNLTTTFHENFVISSIHFDFEKKLLKFVMKSPHAVYTGKYEAKGEILDKPVHENGNVNMTFDYIELNATVNLDFKMKDDKKYLEAVSCTLIFNAKNFELTPYDHAIVGEPMTAEQQALCQSYIDKIPELLESENTIPGDVVVNVLNKIFATEPFGDIFLP